MISDYFINIDIYSWQVLSIVFFAGFAAGFINTFAGSGTAINYFLFFLLGIPINVASGTVRLGVIMQAIATSLSFYKKKQLDVVKALFISIPVTAGAIIGAEIAVSVNLMIFERLIGVVLLIMLFFLFYDSDRWIKGKLVLSSRKVSFWHLIIYFLIGIYGGFLHIGFGIFMIAALVYISGYDLVKAAAIKIFVVLIYTPFVFVIFMLNNQVEYLIGFVTGLGNLTGGLLAASLATKWGAGFIRWILIFVLIVFSLKLFGLVDF
ncbi:MAG: sulfite exporter TauE/SafE family protein [Bacteroidales bacterium]|nr:sulfite exporter TauE/SafE family protein [Bacteroidales bacterium]MBN2755962.1 sulfite exporter TauE/SafE family protein [Bacteroidales bacterium]